MPRYNVGDHVRVITDIENRASYGCAPGMVAFAGQVVTINCHEGGTYRINEDDGRWAWGETDFSELVSTVVPATPEVTDYKATLKAKWGTYCDTDKLVEDMRTLLTKYGHNNTEKGVCTILEKYFTNKKSLIDLFKTSPSYMGDMRIMLDVEIERDHDSDAIYNFCINFLKAIDAEKAILKYKDDKGKTLGDYIKCGIKSFNAKDLLNADMLSKLTSQTEGRANFTEKGATIASHNDLDAFSKAMSRFAYIKASTINKDNAEYLSRKGCYDITEGLKTPRAFNKICTYYKLDKANPKTEFVTHNGETRKRTVYPYNKLFAQYADMVSEGKRKLKFFISLNPIDYLTMSFGVSWASCHTIDKNNRRGMPNSYSGAYCGGTMSYMLDSTSFITFVHDHVPTDWEDGKIYRNMFHFSDNLLVQGRVYPQGNDGNTDLYKVFRGFVQDELGKLIGLETTTWTKKSGACGGNTTSIGSHYHDYTCYSGCNLSYPKERPEAANVIVPIGRRTICPVCGREGNIPSERITHYDCNR